MRFDPHFVRGVVEAIGADDVERSLVPCPPRLRRHPGTEELELRRRELRVVDERDGEERYRGVIL